MNTLRKKLTAIGVAGALGVSSIALPAAAAPVAPSQNSVKQAAPQQSEDIRHRRWVGPAIALGVIGGVLATQHYRHRHYYYDPYYAPAYYYAPGPYYYYGPRYRYYGW
jgi:hypothetical protein